MKQIPRKGRVTDKLKDVFVLGAGASYPYGFPTGFKLITDLRDEHLVSMEQLPIIAKINGVDPNALLHQITVMKIWNTPGGGGMLYAQWHREVRGSVILTIDQFLRNRSSTEVQRLGKALMARKILEYEKNCLMTVPKADPSRTMQSIDWIQHFLSRIDLCTNWEEYLKSAVFITFNYDRVLEYFLRQYLVVDQQKSEKEAVEFIDSMSIYHMNGYLGRLQDLPFGNLSHDDGFSFQSFGKEHKPTPLREQDFVVVGDKLRTVWDADSGENASAKSAIATAQRIFVLGTSFIPENLEAIGLTVHSSGFDISTRTNTFGTALGLSDAEVERAKLHMGISIPAVSPNFLPKVNCKDFVIDYVTL